ncbi:MAG: hypothetical protein KKB20_02595 [Proteobacteria bacterium]|nr:hypothetical protein [Pseudomonadota bacterium]
MKRARTILAVLAALALAWCGSALAENAAMDLTDEDKAAFGCLDANADGTLDQAEFCKIDKNGDHKISREEYCCLWKDKERAGRYFDQFDLNRDGYLTAGEPFRPKDLIPVYKW